MNNSGNVVNRRKILKGSAAAVAAGFYAPNIVRAAIEQQLIVGALLPITGPISDWGVATWQGIELACALVTEQGGIRSMGGTKLKAIVADTEGKPQLAASQAEKLLREGAIAHSGTCQSAATTIA